MSGFHDQLTESLPALWRYAYALTRDRAAADDLVQDCAERALRKRYLWLPHRPLRPWLMKMLLNSFRNRYRAETAHATVPLDDAPTLVADGASAETRLELAQTLAAVRALPPDQRDALLIVAVGGLDYKQAAGALSIPLGTLMSRLSRARARLRDARTIDATPPGTAPNVRRLR